MFLSNGYRKKKRATYSGTDLQGGGRAQGARALLFFPGKNFAHKQKMQKCNINKIYQTEPKKWPAQWPLLKQKRLLALSNSSINSTGITAQESNLKRLELLKSITLLCALRKNNSSGTEATTVRCSRKQLIVNCKNVKADNGEFQTIPEILWQMEFKFWLENFQKY